MPSFSVEKRCCLPMCCSSTIRNVLSSGMREAGDRRRRPTPRARSCWPCGAPRRPSRRLLQQRLFRVADEVAAFGLQLLQEGVVDRGVDQQVAVGRAAGAVVVGLADARVARRLARCRRSRRSPSWRCRRRRRRPACRSCRPPSPSPGRRWRSSGRRSAHQLVRERDARPLDALQQIFGRARACGAPRASCARFRSSSSCSPGCGEKMTASLHLSA